MEMKSYTILEAARMTDIPETELRCAISDGLILARYFQNTGEYRIEHNELAHYVKRSRRVETQSWVRKRKVLIIGEEPLFAGTLKLELKRDEKVDVKSVTWGKEDHLMSRRPLATSIWEMIYNVNVVSGTGKDQMTRTRVSNPMSG